MTISKGRWPHRCCALSTTCRVHFGLIVLLVGYVCLGAYMFMVVEGPYRETREQRFDRLTQQPRRELLNTLWSLKDADRRNFTGEANAAIVDYEDVIINTYSGSASWHQWNFATCIYLAVTALTTIGYGDVAPITQTGRVLMIFYSLVGVPLNLLFLSNFGILLATYTSGKFDKIGKAVKKSGKRISKRLKWDKSVDLTDPECDQETWRENWHYRRSDAVSVTSLGQYNSAFTTMNEAPVCDISRIGAAPPNGSAARRVSYASAMNGTCQAKNEFQKVNSQSETHTISELRDIELKVANATVSDHDLRGQSSENCADKA
ncbi:uncharacterized protein [Ptychodera flava]|uniref:uncharacterized protein n=1 Tax=Ptychodera flava TaxID=63121 RepID=UPI00396A4DB6